MAEQRRTTKSVKLTEPTHGRLSDHCREGETLSGAIDRAIDALEREDSREPSDVSLDTSELVDELSEELAGDDLESYVDLRRDLSDVEEQVKDLTVTANSLSRKLDELLSEVN